MTTDVQETTRRCECGSGLAAEECCEAPPAGPGRMLALAGIFLVLLGVFVYTWFINPPPPLPELGDVTHYTRVAGVDTSALDPQQAQAFLDACNTRKCPCGGCNLTLAACLSQVETAGHECNSSLPAAKELLTAIQAGQPLPPVNSGAPATPQAH